MRIEVWSDVACPWCWLGKAHLDEAIRKLGVDAQIEFRSYQLSPGKRETRPVKEYLAKRFGSAELVDAAHHRLNLLGDQVGLGYDFDRALSADTFDAHRLHHYAKTRGLGNEIMARLLLAQHGEGEDVASRASLVKIGVDVGLEKGEVERVLASEAYADEVRADIEMGRELGVQGVPFFVIDRKLAVSGAQPVAVFAQALTAARERAD